MTKRTKWHVRPAKTQISLGIRPVWSEYSLCAQRVAKDPRCRHADSEDSGQTWLIWVFAGRTCRFVGFVMRRFIWFCHEAANFLYKKWAASCQNQRNGMCAQQRLGSAWASAMIRVFTVRMTTPWVLSYPLSAQRILCGCTGWFVSSLGTCQFVRFVMRGLNYLYNYSIVLTLLYIYQLATCILFHRLFMSVYTACISQSCHSF